LDGAPAGKRAIAPLANREAEAPIHAFVFRFRSGII